MARKLLYATMVAWLMLFGARAGAQQTAPATAQEAAPATAQQPTSETPGQPVEQEPIVPATSNPTPPGSRLSRSEWARAFPAQRSGHCARQIPVFGV